MDAEQTREECPRAASGWDERSIYIPPKAENGNGKLTPPSTIGEWSIVQIIKALSRPLPDSMLETRRQGGANIKYISWHSVDRVLDKYAPGWNWAIMKMELSSDRIFVVGRLSITASDGMFYREATGTEELKEAVKDKQTGELIIREMAYGDPSSNAESMAFRRAAAKFGLGLYLYDR